MPRIYRKTERTADVKAEIERIRNVPKTDAAAGERIARKDLNAVLQLIAALPRRRKELGIDQVDLAKRLGIERSALCRLETFKVLNPTVWTLCTGRRLSIAVSASILESPRNRFLKQRRNTQVSKPQSPKMQNIFSCKGVQGARQSITDDRNRDGWSPTHCPVPGAPS